MRIAILGQGFVGKAMLNWLGSHADITTYDPAYDDSYPKDEIACSDFAIVCVDTPSRPDGTCNIDNVRKAVFSAPVDILLVRSAVPPGTAELLQEESGKKICVAPEFLGESDYHNYRWNSSELDIPFFIIGGDAMARGTIIDHLMPALGPAKQIFQCNSREAEMIKYVENAYLAAKVTYVNEMRAICERADVDWHTVRSGWLLDPRVEPLHTAAFVNSRGFAGKCLPKDLDAIITHAKSLGYIPRLLDEVRRSNARLMAVSEGRLVDSRYPIE